MPSYAGNGEFCGMMSALFRPRAPSSTSYLASCAEVMSQCVAAYSHTQRFRARVAAHKFMLKHRQTSPRVRFYTTPSGRINPEVTTAHRRAFPVNLTGSEFAGGSRTTFLRVADQLDRVTICLRGLY